MNSTLIDMLIFIGICLLIIFSSSNVPYKLKFEMTYPKLFILLLTIYLFIRICLFYKFRKKADNYGYGSIGGFRGMFNY